MSDVRNCRNQILHIIHTESFTVFVHVVSPYSFQEHAAIILLRTHFLHCCRDIRYLVLLRAQKSEGLSALKPRESLAWKRLERRLPSWTKSRNNRKPYIKHGFLCNLALRRLPGIQSHGQNLFSLPIQGTTLHVFFVYQQRSASCSGTCSGTCVPTIKSTEFCWNCWHDVFAVPVAVLWSQPSIGSWLCQHQLDITWDFVQILDSKQKWKMTKSMSCRHAFLTRLSVANKIQSW